MTEGQHIAQCSVSDAVGIQQPQIVRSDTFYLVRVQETSIERGARARGSTHETNRHRPGSLRGVQPASRSALLPPIHKLLKEVVGRCCS